MLEGATFHGRYIDHRTTTDFLSSLKYVKYVKLFLTVNSDHGGFNDIYSCSYDN